VESPFRVASAGVTDVGRKRKHNEDVVLVREDLFLWVVADGAGGHAAGEVAAALAARSVANYMGATVRKAWDKPVYDTFGFPNGARRLAAAIRKANQDVLEIAQSNDDYKNMVTTVVAAHLSTRSGLLHVAHVGDSRCYRLRSCQLEQLTHDHSLLVEVLEREPDLDDAVVAKMPRNVVTRALGMEEHVRVTFRSFAVLPGDRYLLCSDGLSGMVSPSTIESALTEPMSPEETVSRLIALANEGGGRDNITAIVIDVESDEDLIGWDGSSTPPGAGLASSPPDNEELDSVEIEDMAAQVAALDALPPDLAEKLIKLLERKTSRK
jgi:protein phosphatase